MKVCNAACGFFVSKANLRDGLRTIKKILSYICGLVHLRHRSFLPGWNRRTTPCTRVSQI